MISGSSENMKYLVSLKPPLDVCQRLESVQESLGLNLIRRPRGGLHCTLKVMRVGNEPKLVDKLEKINVDNFPLELELGDYALFNGRRLVVRIKPTISLILTHYRVLRSELGIHNRCRSKLMPSQFEGDQEREEIYGFFGSPYVGKFYSPHITLGRVREFPDELEDLSGLAFSCDKISVDRLLQGENNYRSLLKIPA
jgi:2'-5' RNA ligase